jgi:hypothetical protein
MMENVVQPSIVCPSEVSPRQLWKLKNPNIRVDTGLSEAEIDQLFRVRHPEARTGYIGRQLVLRR